MNLKKVDKNSDPLMNELEEKFLSLKPLKVKKTITSSLQNKKRSDHISSNSLFKKPVEQRSFTVATEKRSIQTRFSKQYQDRQRLLSKRSTLVEPPKENTKKSLRLNRTDLCELKYEFTYKDTSPIWDYVKAFEFGRDEEFDVSQISPSEITISVSVLDLEVSEDKSEPGEPLPNHNIPYKTDKIVSEKEKTPIYVVVQSKENQVAF